MKKYKILHIAQPTHGGVQVYLDILFRNFNHKDIYPYIVCPPEYKSYNMNIKTCYMKFINMPRELRIITDIKIIFQILKYAREQKIDLIHAHSTKAGFYARFLSFAVSIPCAYTPHAYYYLGKNGFRKQLLLFYERIASKFTDLLIATSHSERKRSVVEVKYPEKKVKVFLNSIEEQNNRLSKKLDNNILMIGRINYQKNPEMFVKVASLVSNRIPKCKFVLLGARKEDTLLAELNESIIKNNMEHTISVINWVSSEEVNDYIKSCDVYIQTSNYESFGYTVAEAMQMQKPVVATNIDGLNELVVHNYNGFLVEKNNSERMASYIIHLLGNDKLRKRMGVNGYNIIINKYQIKKNIYKFYAIYMDYFFEKIKTNGLGISC